MATQTITPVLPRPRNLAAFFSRSLSSSAVSFRQLSAAAVPSRGLFLSAIPSLRSLPTNATTSSRDDHSLTNHRPRPSPYDPPGMDMEHWFVIMDRPEGNPSKDQMIDIYIKTLAQVVGSEEEARKKIYWVQFGVVWAFGVLVSEELTDKIRELPGVDDVLPDSYFNKEEKDYAGGPYEPFINGQVLPYNPK